MLSDLPPRFFCDFTVPQLREGITSADEYKEYPDPTSADPQWLTCDFLPLRSLPSTVSLEAIKATPTLSNLPLVRRPRLSVMPLTDDEFEIIQALAQA